MTPVRQSITAGPENGDCFRACIASILDLELNDVPHFLKGKSNIPDNIAWDFDFIEWLRKYNLGYLEFNVKDYPYAIIGIDLLNSYHLIGGDTEYGCQHKVVGKNGKEIFNPGGVATKKLVNHKNYGFFIKLL